MTTRITRIAKFLVPDRVAVHVDPVTKQTYRYPERVRTLEKYVGQNNVFGTFTTIFKLGVHPTSPYNTPTGIYGYPIDYIQKSFRPSTGTFNVPFPLESRQYYLQIFSVSNIDKCLIFNKGDNSAVKSFKGSMSKNGIDRLYDYSERRVLELYRYYQANLNKLDLDSFEETKDWLEKPNMIVTGLGLAGDAEREIAHMIEEYFGLDVEMFSISSTIKGYEARKLQEIKDSGEPPDPEELLLKINYYLETYSDDSTKFPYEDRLEKLMVSDFPYMDYDNFKNRVMASDQRVACDQAFVWNATRLLAFENPRKWTALLVKLGFSGAIDNGTDTIHENEPTQAVFFETWALKREEVIENLPKQFHPIDPKDPSFRAKYKRPYQYQVKDAESQRIQHQLSKWSRDFKDIDVSQAIFGVMGVIDNGINGYRVGRNGYGALSHLRLIETSVDMLRVYLGWLRTHPDLLDPESWKPLIESFKLRIKQLSSNMAMVSEGQKFEDDATRIITKLNKMEQSL